MDKGFNEDELADIMNEIESLEQEFAQEGFVEDKEPNLEEVAQSVADMAKDEEHSEVLEQVASMPEESIIATTKVESFDDSVSDSTHTSAHSNIHSIEDSKEEKNMKKENLAKTAMNFSVEGDMKLDLSFLVSGNEIKLHISEEGFEIELEGGAKFSLPVNGACVKAA